jgi:hypothetical protein
MSDVSRMDGSNSGYSYFASANFGDNDHIQDRFGGIFTSSEDYISMNVCIENLKNATLNLIEEEFVHRNNIVDNKEKDGFNKLFSTFSNIKTKLVALGCAGHLEQIESFLKPIESQASFEKLKKISEELQRDNFNPYNNEVIRDLQIDISSNSFFKTEIGFELDDFRIAIKKIAVKYSEAYIELFEAENQIKNKLDKFVELSKQLNTILSLEINEGSLELLSGLTKYLGVFFKEQKIIDYFNKFIEARKRFIVFRDILNISRTTLQKTDSESESPLCAVCMSGHVTVAFAPCGHTFCSFCSNKTLNACYICRTKIQSKLKLFFA